MEIQNRIKKYEDEKAISVMIIIRVAVPPVVDLLQVEAQLQVEAAKIQVLRMFRR